MPGKPYLHIVAAVLIAQDGRILASTRPNGRSMAGRWEFPGGKLEPGEGRWQGLVRELQEELDLTPTAGRPLIRLRHDYPDGPAVDLDVWRVDDWQGQPRAREGQAFDWFAPDALTRLDFLDANTPIVAAARLPDRYLITPEIDELATLPDRMAAACQAGVRLIQLRGRWLSRPEARHWAGEAVARAHALGARVLLNGSDKALAEAIQADGLHLPAREAARLSRRPSTRPWLRPGLLGVSCHSADELEQAHALGADFATLGHVRPTPSHPGKAALGEREFMALAQASPLPVYAIGGMAVADLDRLQQAGIQGIAAIRGLWPD